MERCDYYIYVLFRPDGGAPCYVGKGKGNRWKKHERRCYNPHLSNIIAQAKGRPLAKIKFRENLTETEAFDIEKWLIRAIGRETNGGPLVNLTDGGDGVSGRTPEGIERIRRARLGSKHSPETRARMRMAQAARYLRDGERSAETREKISKGRSGIRPTLEARSKMSAAAKVRPNSFLGKRHTEETRAAISASKAGKPSPKRGVPISAEQKQKISDAMKGRPWSEKRRSAVARGESNVGCPK